MNKVRPGVNPNVLTTHFSPEERKILDKIGNEQYVTSGGGIVQLSKTSEYKYS